jgi:hypothetical protein
MAVRKAVRRKAAPRRTRGTSQATPTEKRRLGGQIGHRSSEALRYPGQVHQKLPAQEEWQAEWHAEWQAQAE